MNRERTIVIIGAGFSGVITAVHLLRRGASGPLRVVLVNRSGRMARGVAYGTNLDSHVLNVPAGRMSAFADDEESFLRFARARDAAVTGGTFVPRSLYGDYLEATLEEAAVNAAPDTTLERIVGEVVSIDVDARVRRAQVITADGRTVIADRVVLALGNYPPRNRPVEGEDFYHDVRYVRDPWAHGALQGIGQDDPVLLIGTGLTMVDVALALQLRGQRALITAISTHGLLPKPHRSPAVPPHHDCAPPGMLEGRATARAYLRAVRTQVARLAQDGVDWREVIGSLRSLTSALWQALDEKERRRFLRHVRPYWEVHRHRMAPAADKALSEMLATGALRIHAGRIRRFSVGPQQVTVDVQWRGKAGVTSVPTTYVVNCTGPESDLRRLEDPLIRHLRTTGMLCPDSLGLGLEVSECGALLNAAGQTSPVLYYVGPLLKARYWEATAVPELRLHAARLAAELVASLSRSNS